MSESIVRKHIYFSGDVQGVGFRFRSYYIAQSLGLTGWVENMWDGRVDRHRNVRDSMRRRERISYPVTVQPVEEVTSAELLLSLK